MCELQPGPASSNLAARCKVSFLRGKISPVEAGRKTRHAGPDPTRRGPARARELGEARAGGGRGCRTPSLGKEAPAGPQRRAEQWGGRRPGPVPLPPPPRPRGGAPARRAVPGRVLALPGPGAPSPPRPALGRPHACFLSSQPEALPSAIGLSL